MYLGSDSASGFGDGNTQALAYSAADTTSLGSLRQGSNVIELSREAVTAAQRARRMTFEPPETAAVSADAGAIAAERKRPLVSQLRFQLGGALVVGLLLPLILRWPITSLRLEFISSSMILPSLIAAAIAIITGYWLNRQVTGYPGASDLAYVVPSLALTFGAVLLASFFLRLDYSRYIILTSFLSAVAWLLATGYVRSRHALPQLALVPGGNHRGITKSSGAKWLELRSQNADLTQVEGVVADLRGSLSESWERFVAKCILAGMPVYDVKNVMEALTGRVEIEHLSENSFGSVLPSNLYLKMKRAVDLALALVLLPFFAVAIILAAIVIKLDSPGPIFFAQQRMGFRAKIFTIYKLRTMRHEEDEGSRFTKAGDARITWVGQFLRKYRVDELPQIFNILKGEMSWLGPRPEAVELADWYSTEIPFYIYRHAVRPGISGWAQVNQGNVAEVDAVTLKLQYDFYYIKNFSPLLDLLIVIRTIGTILTGFGSR
jgi:lipopolysaccharide/colanic/teichoic acid biosynthesis glycosyltransferase